MLTVFKFKKKMNFLALNASKPVKADRNGLMSAENGIFDVALKFSFYCIRNISTGNLLVIFSRTHSLTRD